MGYITIRSNRPPLQDAVARPGAESRWKNVGFFFVVFKLWFIEPIWVYHGIPKIIQIQGGCSLCWIFSSCEKPLNRYTWIFGFLDLYPSKMAMFQPWIIFVRTDGGRAEFVGNLLGAARPNSQGNLFLSDNNYECNTFIHFPFGHGMTWFHPLHRPISLIGNFTGILQYCIKTEGSRTPTLPCFQG